MRIDLTRAILTLVALATASCITYTGVSKADGKLYISGATSYVIVSVPFIKRCDIDGQILKCEDLAEEPPKRTAPSADPAASASAPAATATASVAPPAPSASAKPK
jgi:hypothetical protein